LPAPGNKRRPARVGLHHPIVWPIAFAVQFFAYRHRRLLTGLPNRLSVAERSAPIAVLAVADTISALIFAAGFTEPATPLLACLLLLFEALTGQRVQIAHYSNYCYNDELFVLFSCCLKLFG
jgi:heme/copper-type cytochrome/quinol oxidase subunit 1